jgi:penicillin-binding protein 1A
MSRATVLYSADDIRGQVLLKALERKYIGGHLYCTHFEVREAVAELKPSVIIADVYKNLANEIDFLRDLAKSYGRANVIILADPAEALIAEKHAVPYSLILTGPMDPELLVSHVEEFQAGIFTMLKLRHFFRTYLPILFRYFRLLVLVALVLSLGLTGGYVYWCVSTLPDIENLKGYASFESSKIYSYDNVLLSEFFLERRSYLEHAKLPDHVKNAFISTEDKRFHEHRGIDLLRILGALFADIKARGFQQGGSTITQQLTKMIFLTPEKTVTRKVKEIALSLQIDMRYSKLEILELYLNKAYFGSRAYGIETASNTYFGHGAGELSVSEAALLAALIKSPSRFSPFISPTKALRRRDFVLNEMLIDGHISRTEYAKAVEEPLPTKLYGRKYNAPFFVDFCQSVLQKRYGDRLHASGLKIYTTLDYGYQAAAERAVRNGSARIRKRVGGDVEVALLAVELGTGRIKAMVGGTDYWRSQFNRSTDAKRQPGSLFKPIVYLTALSQGFGPEDMVADEALSIELGNGGEAWSPRNYNDAYYGPVTLRSAISYSLNAATVNLARQVGLMNIIDIARDVGIESRIRPYLSSVLGASETTLLDMVYAYAALASGKRFTPRFIDKVIDHNHIDMDYSSVQYDRVIGARTVKTIRSMLRSVVLKGTARRAVALNRRVYGKTGTTNDYADAWFVGFDDNVVVGVWVGRDNRVSIGREETGSRAALPIWIEFMQHLGPSLKDDKKPLIAAPKQKRIITKPRREDPPPEFEAAAVETKAPDTKPEVAAVDPGDAGGESNDTAVESAHESGDSGMDSPDLDTASPH